MNIEATVELRDVAAGFRALSKAATTEKRDFFRDIKKPAKEDLRAHQRAGRGPDGAWPRAAKATRQRKRRSPKGRPRSRPGRLGRIPRSWKTYLDPEQIKFRNMIDFAAAHQDGGTVGRGAVLPAREFAYFSKEFEAKALEEWAERIAARWSKKP